ncbi:hypothetical protein GCM10027341_23650 [Spirosoma knui]
MRNLLHTLVLLTIVLTNVRCESRLAADVSENQVAARTPASDSAQAAQAVVTFLQWYKKNLGAVSRIDLVNQDEVRGYSVNFKNSEQYLAYLKKSNGLTERYLNDWRTYFKERDEGFRLTRQNEGPPTGFDYDLVMLNQDVDEQMDSLNRLTINDVAIAKNQATVTCTLFITYEFRLVRRDNHWLIDEILNLSDE